MNESEHLEKVIQPGGTSEFSQDIYRLAKHCLSQTVSSGPYDKHDLSNAAIIFQHVVGVIAFHYYGRNGVLFPDMCFRNEFFGSMCAQLVLDHTGMDLAETFENPLEESIITVP